MTQHDPRYPGQGQPYPGPQQPMPGQGQPYPGPQQPMPGQGQPHPGQQQPMPGQGQPHPGQQQPMPGQGQPPTPSLAQARAGNKQGRHFEPDYRYVVDVKDVRIADTYYGLKFIVETDVVESECPTISPGDERSWTRSFSDRFGHGPNDIKGWICLFLEHENPGSNPGINWSDEYTRRVAPVSYDKDGRAYGQGTSPAVGSRWLVHAWLKPKRSPTPGSPTETLIVDWTPLSAGTVLGLGPGPQQPMPGQGQPYPGQQPMPGQGQPHPGQQQPMPGQGQPQQPMPGQGQPPPRPEGWPDSLPWPPQ